jgi:hypothetical protein
VTNWSGPVWRLVVLGLIVRSKLKGSRPLSQPSGLRPLRIILVSVKMPKNRCDHIELVAFGSLSSTKRQGGICSTPKREGGRSAVRTVRASAEQIRVPSFFAMFVAENLGISSEISL